MRTVLRVFFALVALWSLLSPVKGAAQPVDPPAPAETPVETPRAGPSEAPAAEEPPLVKESQAPAVEPPASRPASESQQSEGATRPGANLLATGEYLVAADRLRQLLQQDPTATDARFSLGQALFAMGDIDEAVDEYRLVLRDRPTSIPARLHLATALMAKRQWKEAQKELLTVLVQDPKVAAAHHNLATVRYSQGDVRGAIDAYRAALAIAPGSTQTHYHLGVVLRLAGRTKEAVPEFQAAAEAGHPKAQYFLGAAYSSGSGVERDLPSAIRWWMAATEQGLPEAQDALSRLRRSAVKAGSTKEANKTLKAFQAYRDDLWNEFPELTRNGADETVGVALLQAFRTAEAVPTLIRESTAMGELSERYLAALYEQGLPPMLKPFDGRILRYFDMAANDGMPQARLTLARIHALGLGVPADRAKALTILKGLPAGYAEQFLQDLATHPAGTAPQTVPQRAESPVATPSP